MSQGNSARIYLREDRSESYCKKIPGVRLGLERPHPPATGLLASQDPAESTRRIGPGLSCSIHLTDSQARHFKFNFYTVEPQ